MRQNRGQKMEDFASVKVLRNLPAVFILATHRGKGEKSLAVSSISSMKVTRALSAFSS